MVGKGEERRKNEVQKQRKRTLRHYRSVFPGLSITSSADDNLNKIWTSTVMYSWKDLTHLDLCHRRVINVGARRDRGRCQKKTHLIGVAPTSLTMVRSQTGASRPEFHSILSLSIMIRRARMSIPSKPCLQCPTRTPPFVRIFVASHPRNKYIILFGAAWCISA